MAANNNKKKKKGWKKWLVLLILLALIGAYIGLILLPKLKAESTLTYDGYTASIGSISNSMDFSGSISVVNYETLTASGEGTVRQVYVAEEQAVREGDKLIRLSTGETLKANFDGHVNVLNVENGDEVSMGESLIQIVDFENMQVTFRVDEYDIAKIAVGQSCRVNVTALDTDFDSTISHINRIPSNSQGTAYYTVTAEFVVTENVLPGMQVTVVIPQEEAMDAVILSKSALGFDGSNSAYVYKKAEDGSMVMHPVTIGVDNDNYVEILSGVDEGETVYALQEQKELTGWEAMFSNMPMGGGMQMPGQSGGSYDREYNRQPGSSRDFSNMGGGGNFGSMGGGMP